MLCTPGRAPRKMSRRKADFSVGRARLQARCVPAREKKKQWGSKFYPDKIARARASIMCHNSSKLYLDNIAKAKFGIAYNNRPKLCPDKIAKAKFGIVYINKSKLYSDKIAMTNLRRFLLTRVPVIRLCLKVI